jgi:hypothetical protein
MEKEEKEVRRGEFARGGTASCSRRDSCSSRLA